MNRDIEKYDKTETNNFINDTCTSRCCLYTDIKLQGRLLQEHKTSPNVLALRVQFTFSYNIMSIDLVLPVYSCDSK